MTSYGDPQSARARARVPGPSAASTPDDDPSGPRFADDGRPAPDAYRRGVGSGTRGAASVPGAGGRAPVGNGTSGRATVGSASVGAAPVGSASVGSARVGGRAAVGEGGTGGYGGRASVARAAVRPNAAYDELGPATPVSPGGPGGGASKTLSKAAKRRRRGNILTALAAVVVILLGAGVVAGTWFFDDVQLTEPKPESQVTQLLDSEGETIATIGEQNRSIVPYKGINPVIGQAVMAAEDKNFLDHNGIDMKGIMRAAWNNFTGGDQQGASTITQQYARHAAELKEISYNRKLREAVIARKMEDVYGKDEILGNYLNSVYFGRGAYGIEAAVKAYFGDTRSALIPAGKKNAITPAEAAVLAAVIKQPEPVTGAHQGYDPQNNPEAAQERWNYTLNNMVEKGWLPAGERPTEYPKVAEFNPDKCRTSCGNDKPVGKIIKYVKQELLAMGIKQDEWTKGGLQITTTINKKVQTAAENAAQQTNKKSPLNDLDSTYKSALVAVSPTTGEVLGYYGGDKGDGVSWDYAGPNYDKSGNFTGGGRPPGSSFKIYTLLAALSNGYGFDTTWDADKKKANGEKINNSGRTKFDCDKRRCPLDKATVESYNFPFYWLTDTMGPAEVLNAAGKAGVHWISSPSKIGERIDLTKVGKDKDKLSDFGNEVGFGQYAITPLDHANGVATLAADGYYNKAHFVKKVEKRDSNGKFKAYKNVAVKPTEAFPKDVVAAIDHVLQKIPGANSKNLKNSREAIGKTGTWEFKDGESGQNGDAWMVGATRQIATSVWIGREKVNKKTNQMDLLPIKKPDGGNMTGGSVPGQVWKQFMDAASEAIDAPKENFLPNAKVGDPSKKGNGLDPPPPPPEQPECLLNGLICPPGQNNGQPGDGQPGNGQPGNGQPGNGQPGNGNGNGNGQGNQPPPPGEPTQPGTLPGFPDGVGGGANEDD